MKIYHISKTIIFIVALLLSVQGLNAQVRLEQSLTNQNETIQYGTYFKWGMIEPRAGNGVMTVSANDGGYRARIVFATSSFFDNFYRLRDTIECQYDANRLLYKAAKHTSENKTLRLEDYDISYIGSMGSARFVRTVDGEVTADTLVRASNGMDMIGLVMEARGIDWGHSDIGQSYHFNIFSGKSIVKTSLQLEAVEVIPLGSSRYKTYRIAVHVWDKAFESGGKKADTQIWLSADKNKILLQGSMALKVGYARVYMKSIRGARYPMTSRVS